jgi:hypothetical protein
MNNLPRFGSKRWNEDRKRCGSAAYKCRECGRLLLHPTSIIRHFGGACLKKLLKQQESINLNKDGK